MIVLDTNVISELMRAEPSPTVLAWVEAQPSGSLCTTAINQAEILCGIAALPEGRRRSMLSEAADAMFAEDFHGRVLPFGAAAAAQYAAVYGAVVMSRRRAGKPIEGFDALIAATARAAGAAIATRDTGGFGGCGLELIDPWAAS
jgi:predicted nucleic acid-binding protein